MAKCLASCDMLGIKRLKITSLAPATIGCVTNIIIEYLPMYDIIGNHTICLQIVNNPQTPRTQAV